MTKTKNLYEEIERIRPRLEGWCSREKAKRLADAVVEFRPQVSVEIGVWGGSSLIALALAHEYVEVGHCYGIDPWSKAAALHGVQEIENLEWWSRMDYEAIFLGCMVAIIENGLTSRCTVFRTTSERAHPLFDEIDLLHIDGNHSEPSSTLDVFLYLPKLRSGGHLFFDDINWHSTKNAVRLVEERCDKVDEIVSDPGGKSEQFCAVYRKRK